MLKPANLMLPTCWFFGELAKEAFLASVKALPQKASLEGFQFQFPELHLALQESLI